MFIMHASSAHSLGSVCTPINGGEHILLQRLVHGRAHSYLALHVSYVCSWLMPQGEQLSA